MQPDIICSSFLWGELLIFSSANVPLQDFMIISTHSLKSTIQPAMYQTKLLWIISAFILSQSHHLERRKAVYAEPLCALPWRF